ncbi:hypothetical protein Cmtc_18980 [Cupriavidus sp. TKC]|uniref:DUF7694 domain-containing protein n=1 Tax=Cupriavidus sp. TKC TaxID=2880159 RepID=UPI0025A8C017|nr:hypothetical protein [Cupriavidus sp. TKC]GMG89621.1 hypothetical protein Cmtc_08410 [Cupriavidus sp. TKC]GMG90678.1 hypothetical protein Cmtc_18980 [Cupriavidus sp. TKC]
MNTTREERRAMERENAKHPKTLAPVDGWQHSWNRPDRLIEVWRSRDFLVQVFTEGDGIVRASVNRTTVDARSDRWHDGIAWDELQRIKREIGRGHLDAVEAFPADRDVVNVANMRHLFIFDTPLPYVWRKKSA